MKHVAVINKKPIRSGKESIPDGAICGNGDLGLILGNCKDGMRIYISKSDIWHGVENAFSGGMKPLGYINIDIPQEKYEKYYVEQDMDNGEIRCDFDGIKINVRAAKTENAILLELENAASEPKLKVFEGETAGEKGEYVDDNCQIIYRDLKGDDCEFETYACATMKKVSDGKYYACVATNHDTEKPLGLCLSKTREMTEEKYAEISERHYSAWKNFWSKSSFTLSDEELEIGWYASQYFLAVCAGNPNFAPGIFANFITIEKPAWHSDYHLNYNYQAPFYAACSSNHVELTDCYHAPLEDFLEKGRSFAEKFGCRGILYPVGMMPKGICSELDKNNPYWFERLFLGQKSNAVHPANIMIFRWKATRDKEYAKNHAYPYVKECLEFFEDYATYENGRYSICRDATHEVPYYKHDFKPSKYKRYINDKNNALTLGMLRLALEAGIDMAKELGIDSDKQKKWQDMLDNLAPFATYYRFFRKVFRYTEKGQMWNDGGDVGLQHIYPGGCVGLSSDEKMLKIARNTFKMKEKYCYVDDNAVSSFYPMAARLGIDPHKVISKYKELNRQRLMQNKLYEFVGGCLENCSIAASMLNEMALQSYEKIIRIFPDWDRTLDCKYEHLRADGAFLVSSEMRNGEIISSEILSEIGTPLCLENPYDKADINGKIYTDRVINIPTNAGETFTIKSA